MFTIAAAKAKDEKRGKGENQQQEQQQITREFTLAKQTISRWKLFVLSNKAKRFGENALLKAILLRWKHTHMKHWRMGIKALVHHKVVVSTNLWKFWREKLEVHREKSRKWERAVSFANNTLAGKCIHHWMMYRDHRRIQSLRTQFARSSHESMLTQRLFQIWLGKFRFKQYLKQLEEQAMRADCLRIKKCCHRMWKSIYRRRVGWDEKVNRSLENRRRKLLETITTRWKEYTNMRKMKAERSEHAWNFYITHSRKKSFDHWLLLRAHRLKLHQYQSDAEEFYDQAQLRRAYLIWKQAAQESQKERESLHLAKEHRINQIKKATLLRLNTFNKWKQVADNTCNHWRLRVSFAKWRIRLVSSQLEKEKKYMEPGKIHYENHLKTMVLESWQHYVTLEKAERIQEQQAIDFHRHSLLATSFRKFHHRYAIRRVQRDMEKLAHESHRLNTLQKSFTNWINRAQDEYRERRNIRKVERFQKKLLLRKCFNAIARNADLEAIERENENIAVVHHNRTIALKSLHGWRYVASIANERAIARRSAIHHLYITVLNRCMSKWVSSVIARQRERFLMDLAAMRHDKSNMLRALRAWKQYTSESKNYRHAVSMFLESIERGNLRRAWDEWKSKLNQALEKKRVLERQRKEEEHKLVDKVFKAWNIYTTDRVVRRNEIQTRISHVEGALLQARVRRCFQNWVTYHSLKTEKKLRDTTACLLRKKNILAKSLKGWKRKHELQKREKKNNALAIEFHETRLQKVVFCSWKSRNVDWRQVYHKTYILPVQHYTRRVIKIAFDAWKVYIQTRRKKAALMKEAEGWRQELTLRDGAILWMKGAQNLRKMREGYRVQESFRNVEKEVLKVRKFALRWRAKTIASREKRRMQPGANALNSILRPQAFPGLSFKQDALLYSAPPSVEPVRFYADYSRNSSSHGMHYRTTSYEKPPRKPAFLEDLLRSHK
ncbi:hypothetical protein BDR26DRAFT_850022, partial [Obelidium mucronatum]